MRTIELATLVLLAGCSSTRSLTPEEFEAELRQRSRITVEEDDFILCSPYGGEATEPYAAVLRRELREVRECFGDASAVPVRIYLVPVSESEAPAPDEPWRHAAQGGLEGLASPSGFALVWVRPDALPAQALAEAEMGSSQLRHELAHLFTYRAGLTGKSWLNEGVAQHVAHSRVLDGEMRPDPFPASLVKARHEVTPGELSRLLAWSNAGDDLTLEQRRSRYAQAETLLRFLLERSPESDFAARLRQVHALDERAIAALEPEWLSWLGEQDALVVVRRELASTSAERRRRAAALLPILAEAGASELFSEAADALALGALRDPETFEPASTFLVFFRASSLSGAALAALEASGDPREALLAATLRAKRGEPFDLDRARAIWNGLDPGSRARFGVAAVSIPGLRDP